MKSSSAHTQTPEIGQIFQGVADFDLELVETRTLDGHIQKLNYQPTLH